MNGARKGPLFVSLLPRSFPCLPLSLFYSCIGGKSALVMAEKSLARHGRGLFLFDIIISYFLFLSPSFMPLGTTSDDMSKGGTGAWGSSYYGFCILAETKFHFGVGLL